MTGKIIGGFLGLMAGGIFGAIFGLFLGHWFDRHFLGGPSRFGARDDQDHIVEICFELLGCVCKADGQVSEVEIQAAEKLLQKLRIQGERRQRMIRAFNRGKQENFDLDASVSKLRQACQRRPLWLRLALEIVLTGALADGRLDEAERQVLSRIAQGLGMRGADFEAILQLMSGGAHARGGAWGPGPGGPAAPSHGQQLQQAYTALGVQASDADAVVRKAYRRLMSQHHPDKLAARDMPDALREQAEIRVREIRAAWDLIKAERGL